jgi:hypothetical protein
MIAANARCLKFSMTGLEFLTQPIWPLQSRYPYREYSGSTNSLEGIADQLMIDLDRMLSSEVASSYFLVIGQFFSAVALGFVLGTIIGAVGTLMSSMMSKYTMSEVECANAPPVGGIPVPVGEIEGEGDWAWALPGGGAGQPLLSASAAL